MKVRRLRSPAWKWSVRIVGAALGIAVMSAYGAHAASVVPVSRGTVFGGFTSQRLPSFFQVSKNQKMLLAGSVALKLKCRSGVAFVVEDDFRRLPIAANGRLHGGWSVPLTKLRDGTSFAGAGSLSGYLDRRHQRLIGTWHVHSTLGSATGQSDVCDSGAVRFTALQ